MALDRDFKVLVPGIRMRYTNNHATDALYEGDALVHVAGVVGKMANTNTTGLLGVCVGDVANGDQGEIFLSGLFKIAVVGTINFTQFGAVYSASSAGVDDGTTSDVSLGYVAGIDPASGVTSVDVFIVSHLFTATTHA